MTQSQDQYQNYVTDDIKSRLYDYYVTMALQILSKIVKTDKNSDILYLLFFKLCFYYLNFFVFYLEFLKKNKIILK